LINSDQSGSWRAGGSQCSGERAYPGTEIEWDPFGNPGGSLRITTTEGDRGTKLVRSARISGPEGLYLLEGQTYHSSAEPFVTCRIYFSAWETDDCSGPAPVPISTPQTFDVWSDHTGEANLDESWTPPIRSIAVALTANRATPGGGSTCYFDNIVLRGPTPTFAIPTTSPVGLVLLAAAIALAGGIALRRGLAKLESIG
jgi:hypothetical protein